MNYLFFFIYLVLFCWLLNKIKFIRECGLNKKTIIFLFLLRIAVGIINGYLNLNYFPFSDTATFQHDGVLEYHLLFNNPGEYFSNIFQYNNSYTAFLDTTDSFWNNMRSDFIVKLLSVLNIFSFGNFYINIVFFNFIIFFGAVALFNVFNTIYPDRKKLLIIVLFLLPSTIYFTSGIHRDGLIFLSLCLIIYNLYYVLKDKIRLLKKLMLITTGVLIIFLLRNFILIALLPAIIALIIAERNYRKALQYFIIVYAFFILLFFLAGYLHPAINFPNYVSSRQIDYIEIAKQSNSAININPLFPNFRSFLNNAPQALNHSLMRPYLTEKYTLLYIPAAIEIFIYEIILLLFIFFKKENIHNPPLIYFCIFFSLSMFLMIGYTIPIIGALIRYRSIYFPFILLPIICNIDWEKIKRNYINKLYI